MEGLMMDFPLTLTHIMRRAESFFGEGEIVTRLPDKSFHRTTHGEALRRARQLAVALQKAGLERGDRVEGSPGEVESDLERKVTDLEGARPLFLRDRSERAVLRATRPVPTMRACVWL